MNNPLSQRPACNYDPKILEDLVRKYNQIQDQTSPDLVQQYIHQHQLAHEHGCCNEIDAEHTLKEDFLRRLQESQDQTEKNRYQHLADIAVKLEIEDRILAQTIYLTLQCLEVDEHKYYLSQKRGYDIGIETAFEDWTTFVNDKELTHAARFRQDYLKNSKNIELICKERCNFICKSFEKCSITKEELHQLLQD